MNKKSKHNVLLDETRVMFMGDIAVQKTVPVGSYMPLVDSRTGEVFLETLNLASDEIIDIDSPEYKNVTGQIEKFILPETKQKYKDLGTIYKRNIIMYGEPGTGKSVCAQKVSKMVAEIGGITLFVPYHYYPSCLRKVLSHIRDLQPSMIVILLEEFEEMIRRNESEWLSLLDGEVQIENVIFIATTNHYEEIPDRIKRAGRFPIKVEFMAPDEGARRKFIESKIKDSNLVDQYTAASDGFTIDQIKELLVSCYILDRDIETVKAELSSQPPSQSHSDDLRTVEFEEQEEGIYEL